MSGQSLWRNRAVPRRRSAAVFLVGLLAGTMAGFGFVRAAGAQIQAPPGSTDLGPNVDVFDPGMPREAIQARLNAVFKAQETNQFGASRNALLFKPGTYSVDANIGFNTQIAGLGLSPDDVAIQGHVHAEADWMGDNGTDNFWRAAENMSVFPSGGKERWAVSQAAPFRRMHIHGDLQLDPRGHGWSSGGFMADSKVDGEVSSGSQQQYLSRNDQFGRWSGSVWNMVFVGVSGAPPPHFPSPSHTVIAQTPVSREKPFLYLTAGGGYAVFVPALRTNSVGTSWSEKLPGAGVSLPLSHFYIAKPGATAAGLNQALAQGKDLLITPGVYHLSETVHIARANTVVLGLGFATLIPDNGIMPLEIADVDGVKVAGILLDAGPVNSPLLLEVGPTGCAANHAANPTSLSDVFIRVGGASAGKATTSVSINSNNVIVDHTWLWRADHGDGVGWNVNTADNGLIVNGNNVTCYGLFVEHYQKYNVVWAGNGGQTYMFQNEMPYDPPDQASWMRGTSKGFPAYTVTNAVATHEAWGVGSYCNFTTDRSIVADQGFEAPNKPGIKFHNLLTISLGGRGVISNVIDNLGGATPKTTVPRYLAEFPEN
jgi:hypothetical protein